MKRKKRRDIEKDRKFVISVAGERIHVPARATYNIEHERGRIRRRQTCRSAARTGAEKFHTF